MSASIQLQHSSSITDVRDFINEEAVEKEVLVQEAAKNETPVSPFTEGEDVVNVCSSKHGARILFATDEWFATAENLLKDGPPIFDPDLYCSQGKVMDGWESRRRREAGHDWCIIKLSKRVSQVVGIEIDTAHFTGNQVPKISLELGDLTCDEEVEMVQSLPGSLNRLLYGGIQGTGCSPQQVATAEEACRKATQWAELLPMSVLQPGYENTRMHYFRPKTQVSGTHLRVNYYPDGGVARLRLWTKPMSTTSSADNMIMDTPKPIAGPAYIPIKTGSLCTVVSHFSGEAEEQEINMPSRQPYHHPELSSSCNGGTGITCSNKHYGEPSNLIQSTLGKDMGDGWETARHPDRPSILIRDPNTNLVDSPLMDWAILKLGLPAPHGVSRILLDTKHFRGNYPESVLVEGCSVQEESENALLSNVKWFPLIKRCRMAPDSEHVFEQSLNQIDNADQIVTHIRVSIYPDGGLSRVRVYGPTVSLL